MRVVFMKREMVYQKMVMNLKNNIIPKIIHLYIIVSLKVVDIFCKITEIHLPLWEFRFFYHHQLQVYITQRWLSQTVLLIDYFIFVLLRQLATFASTLPAIPISCWTKNEDEKQAQHYQYAGPHVEVVLMRMFPMGRVLLVMGTFFQLSDAREPVPMQLGKSDAKFALSPQTPYNGLLFRSPVELGRPSQSVHELSESLMRFLDLV